MVIMFLSWLYITVAMIVVADAATGPYFNSSRTAQPSITASASASASASDSCTGCSASVGVLDVKWRSDILHHTAAVVIVSPDNSTNSTKTSTVSFQAPSAPGGLVQYVDGNVFSTEFAGTEYSLSYPTPYSGLADVQVTEQYLETNDAGQTICTGAATTLSYQFLSSPQGTGIAGVPQGCSIEENNAPVVLIRISYVTATSTRSASHAAVVLATGQPFAGYVPNVPVHAPSVKASAPNVPAPAVPVQTSPSSSFNHATSVNGVPVAGVSKPPTQEPPPPPSPPQSPPPPIPSAAQPFVGTAESEPAAVTESGILLAVSAPVVAPALSIPPNSPPAPTASPAQPTLPILPAFPPITLQDTTYSLLTPSSSASAPSLVLATASSTLTLQAGSLPPLTISSTAYALATSATALYVMPCNTVNGSETITTTTSTLALPPVAALGSTAANPTSSGSSNANPQIQAYETSGIIIVPIPLPSTSPTLLPPSNSTNPSSIFNSSTLSTVTTTQTACQLPQAYLLNWLPLLPSPLSPPLTISGQTITLLPSGTGVVVAGPKGTKTAEIAPASSGSSSAAGGAAGAGEALGQALGQAGFVGSGKGGGSGGGSSGSGAGGGKGGGGQPFQGGASGGEKDLGFALVVGVIAAVGGAAWL